MGRSARGRWCEAVRVGVVVAILAATVVAASERVCAQGARRAGVDESRIGASGGPSASRSSTTTAREAILRKDAATPEDDWTFRPTVIVRRGGSQGTGTVIASVEGKTLVLTAAHVVRDPGLILVELHRFNLGLERAADVGRWPLFVAADLIGSDPAADIAVVQLRTAVALPYVARLFDDEPEALEPESAVTSLGVDLGARLSSWNTKLVETARFQLEKGDSERPFFITLRIPEHGRSGGGLFTKDGRLVGVCVGHAEMVKGRRMGVFASIESVRMLIREHDLAAAIEQSTSRSTRPRRGLAETHEPERRRRVVPVAPEVEEAGDESPSPSSF